MMRPTVRASDRWIMTRRECLEGADKAVPDLVADELRVLSSLETVQRWAQSPETRAYLDELYTDNRVSRHSVETDLGLVEPPVLGTPISITLRMDLPNWLAPGRFSRVSEVAGQWAIAD
jgi:hypothetical protein